MIEDDGDRERRIRENLHAHNANNGLNITPPTVQWPRAATEREGERETVQNSFGAKVISVDTRRLCNAADYFGRSFQVDATMSQGGGG